MDAHGPLGLLGHLEFLLGIRHATNARCAEPCRLLSIDLQAFSRLIAHATDEHGKLIDAAGAQDLVRREGFRFVFRTAQALDQAVQRAALVHAPGLAQAFLRLHSAYQAATDQLLTLSAGDTPQILSTSQKQRLTNTAVTDLALTKKNPSDKH